jgi:hypothetical protein
MPEFVSANIHKSVDGTRVANYAQWRSQTISRRCCAVRRRSHI